MAIVNLGQLGEPRQSPLGDTGNAMYKGSIMGQMLANTKTKAEELKQGREKINQSKTALDILTRRENLDRANQTYELLSQRYITDGKENMDNFIQTDKGKEVLKYLKKELPEVFDEGGNFSPKPMPDILKGKAESAVNQAKIDFGNGKATEDQIALLLLDYRSTDTLPLLMLEKLGYTIDDNGNAVKAQAGAGSEQAGQARGLLSTVASAAITNLKSAGEFLGRTIPQEQRPGLIMMLQNIISKAAMGSGNVGIGSQLANQSRGGVTNFRVEE